MHALVTGSAGHLGEALVRTLRAQGHGVIGIDIRPSAHTTHIADITDPAAIARLMPGITTVFHTATLHKPHVATHPAQRFIDTNISGTLALLEAAAAARVQAFIYTSTTSVFGDALIPAPGAPAAWITEDVTPVPKNIYGVTKSAAEDLCHLFARNHALPAIVLRTSRFFPEPDDNRATRDAYDDTNAKVNEFAFRRIDIEDAVTAHLLAARHAPRLGFARYIISATTPFLPEDTAALRHDAPAVLRHRVPAHTAEYARRGWSMFPTIDRVYANARAQHDLGWQPRHSFAAIIDRLRNNGDASSPLAREIGAKAYHDRPFADGPYPVA